MTEYFVPTGPGEAEYDEKRSRFLGYLSPVSSEQEARDFITAVKKKHYDARHNCWCYIIKDGPERYSDDGEPQGTAGIPMLEVFRKKGMCNFVCVVTRYFGGILLGAGGLLRAYTAAAAGALADAGVSIVRRSVLCRLECSYSSAERMKQEITAFGGAISGIEYGSSITIKAAVPEERFAAFSERIFDISAGAVRPEEEGEAFFPVPVEP